MAKLIQEKIRVTEEAKALLYGAILYRQRALYDLGPVTGTPRNNQNKNTTPFDLPNDIKPQRLSDVKLK